ncbi:MAG: 3-keto-5-aminohexanoate cleavage protein [Rhodococcus sp. (in: high G+C Gram-positive bacteria)]
MPVRSNADATRPVVIGVHVNENTPRLPNPHVPWTPDEIAVTARDSESAGASLMHFHGRTPTGTADHSAATYAEIVRTVRATSSLLLAPSMANLPGATVDERLSNLAPNQSDPATRSDFLVIDMGCANMDLLEPETGRFATDDKVFVNDTRSQLALLDRAADLGMKPYLTSFNISWTRTILAHARTQSLPLPLVIAFVLGGDEFVAAHPASAAGLRAQLDLLPSDVPVESVVSAYRGNVLAAAEESIKRGGHVAIGTGDYHYGELGHPSTPELVERIVHIARRYGREPASPSQARDLLGVNTYATH